MKREHLTRPPAAMRSPDHGAPPELAALTANVRARLAFWADVHARDVMFETGAVLTRSAVVLTREALAAAAGDAAGAADMGTNGADAIAARVIWRTVESIAPPKMVRAVLQRPSLAWRYPLATVQDETGEPAAVAAAWLDRVATVAGTVDVPAHFGVAARAKLPPRHAVALYGADDPPPEAMRDATLCIPLAALEPPVTMAEVLAALRAPTAPREARDAADVIARHAATETDPGAELAAAGLAPWGPYAVGAVLCTLREIRDVHGRHRAFAFPTTRESNAAVNHLAATAAAGSWKSSGRVTDETRRPEGEKPSPRKHVLRVQWEGRMLPVQLCLELRDATDEALAAVLDNLSDDGLRDWLALHALADEQGNTGAVRWTWPDHKRVALYSARVLGSHRGEGGERETDDALRRAVIRRLWQFTRAALWMDYGDGKKKPERVGGGPFARIVVVGDPDGLEEERADFTQAGITINRALYLGAHRDAKGERRHFTSIPGAVFRLRGGALRLAVFILRAERMHRDDGMRVQFTERQLMQYARVRGDGKPAAKHMPDARAELARYIAAVTEAMNDGETPGSLAAMTPDPDRPGVYRWTPARWRVEREQLGAAPERPALPAPDRPHTGAALRAWREARGLLQKDAARLLKVGRATLQRAELAADDPLPRSFHRADLAWNVTAADAAAQLGAGAPGPVEGEDAPDAADDTAA